MKKTDVLILGGGLSGLSTAYFLQDTQWINSISIIEGECKAGGLCTSLEADGYTYDIGPHIIFSKNRKTLDFLLELPKCKTNRIKRSNEIFYKGRLIQYPFENDLSKLPEEDLEYCIRTFNHNPYEDYEAHTMLQFFLKTFGKGITDLYLRPYNEKIWKFDPSFMNTRMVERIPKPTREEIQRSASGETVEGYLHQLYFHYPAEGGIESVICGLADKLDKEKVRIFTDSHVMELKCAGQKYEVKTSGSRCFQGELVVSTIPLDQLATVSADIPEKVTGAGRALKYNSLICAFARVPYDLYGEHFTYTIPDKEILFHRISKMDFLGDYYHKRGESTYMVEITYRDGDRISGYGEAGLKREIAAGFVKMNIVEQPEDVEILAVTHHKYAYVIYDMNHKTNVEIIRDYFKEKRIYLTGRFGNFEYWNMDRVIEESELLADQIKEDGPGR